MGNKNHHSLWFTLITCCLFLSPNVSFSKGKDNKCPKPKRKAVSIYEKTKKNNIDLEKKHLLLVKVIKEDPNFLMAYDELATIALKKADRTYTPRQSIQYKNRALNYWKKIIEICPAYRDYYFPYKLAQYYFNRKEYKTAKKYVDQYLNGNKRESKERQEVLKLQKGIQTYFHIINNPVPFDPFKVKKISTNAHDEFLPMLSPDNHYLFFTRKAEIKKHSAIADKDQEMLTRSRQVGPNHFSNGLYMPKPFNQGDYQGGVSISANNKTLYITIVNMRPDLRPEHTDRQTHQHPMIPNGDIYYSQLKENGTWSSLKSVGPTINKKYSWEGQPSISSDGQTLYFVRYYPYIEDEKKHPEHIGRMDIYKSIKQTNGSWGEAINLGDSINTPEDDKTPLIHSDSHTLYFASNGRIGVGGFDIYYARIKKDSTFTSPINLGYPINTEKDEVGFIVSRDGKTAYFSSNINSVTYDVYGFNLYDEAQPDDVIFVKGKVVDSAGKVPNDVNVEIKNHNTGEIRKAVVDDNTGEYVAVIMVDSSKKDPLILTAKKKGYAFSSQLITSDEHQLAKTEQVPELSIEPIKAGKDYEINNINFATNSYYLNENSKIVLNEFIDFLNLNSSVEIRVQGYTDNVGIPQENLKLSKNRASVVYQYLIDKGIKKPRLDYKGFGEENPVASNDTEAGRAKNRRTTFLILSK